MVKFENLTKYPDHTIRDLLGFIPTFLSEDDPRPAVEQLNSNYKHGGGWNRFHGFSFTPKTLTLCYPGDPSMKAVARGKVRNETILIFEHAWVVILQADGTWEASRMD